MERAKAHPRKKFFIEMFTRDLALNDCIMDLIDNSIDGYIKSRKIKINEDLFFKDLHESSGELPIINVTFDNTTFTIHDNCGGISYTAARDDIFNFGHENTSVTDESTGTLGVYGVGLKRAIFKIGDCFEIESKSETDGFKVNVASIQEWVGKDDDFEDWSFSIEKTKGETKIEKRYTNISITKFRPETKMVFVEPSFLRTLEFDIAKVYSIYLDRYVRVRLNGKFIKPMLLRFGESTNVKSSIHKTRIDDVEIIIYAGLAERDSQNEWKAESAGWYISCNGRLVVIANKDELTGWGTGALPQYHSKYKGFFGLVMFISNNSYALPWTTSKRGLNRESLVFQKIRTQMMASAKPVISFLNKMYPSELSENIHERKILENVENTELKSIVRRPNQEFVIKTEKNKAQKTTTKISYEVEKSDVETIRKHLRSPQLTNPQIGKYTFEQFLIRIHK
jgi:hypothetical protein